MEQASVLIVGGGLVGLSASAFLSARGVHTTLVERHADSSPLPRAFGFTTRTMELYRAIGLGDSIPQVPAGVGGPRRVKVESLAAMRTAEEVPWTPGAASHEPKAGATYSVCTGAAIAQDRLEPILRTHAARLGANIRLSTELVSFDQDERGVTSVLRDPEGREYALRADYVIAADGHSSPVREMLGIGRTGRGVIRTVRSILFHAPSLAPLLETGISQFEIEQPGFEAMLTVYRDAGQGQNRWLLIVADDGDRQETDLHGMINRASGKPRADGEIVATGLWQVSALIADRFAASRIFLAGDAAHTLPPARGGYGANTGIEDAHNLAWKIDAVLSGGTRPDLLDTYDTERRPIAWLRHAQIFARPDYSRYAQPADKGVPIIDDVAIELGQLYRSTAIIGAGCDLPSALRPDQWAGQPGTRAPHVWVAVDGVRCSTLDLVQPDWALLTSDRRWRTAIEQIDAKHPSRLRLVLIDTDASAIPPTARVTALEAPIGRIADHPAGKAVLEAHLPQILAHPSYDMIKSMSLRQLLPLSDGEIRDETLVEVAQMLEGIDFGLAPAETLDPKAFGHAFGIGSSGASLIRPDGYIAWRMEEFPAEPTRLLAEAFQIVAARGVSA